MKQCPKCSEKNADDFRFCKSCGENIENVEIVSEDLSAVAGDFMKQANSLFSEGTKRAKEAMTSGVAKAKEVVEAGKEKMQSASASKETPAGYTPAKRPQQEAKQTASSPNGGWDKVVNPSEAASVTIKRYPFFKDEDENAVAVIGEDAVMSDLDGAYTKPYAVLTQRRLYCKNEAGTFITDVSEVQKIEHINIKTKIKSAGANLWLIGLAIVILTLLAVRSVFVLLSVIVSVYFCKFSDKEYPLNLITAQVAILVGAIWEMWVALSNNTTMNLAVMAAFVALFTSVMYTCMICWAVKKQETFLIKCAGGTFSFLAEYYSQQEFSDFHEQAARVCPVNMKNASYQPNRTASYGSSGGGKRVFTTLCVVALLIGVVCFAWYSLTHCKVSGCSSEVYKDGYCQYHYYAYKVDNAAHDAFDGVSGFLGDLFGT